MALTVSVGRAVKGAELEVRSKAMVREGCPGWCSSADWKITVTEAHNSVLSHSWGSVTHIESVPSKLGKIENRCGETGWVTPSSVWQRGGQQSTGFRSRIGCRSRLSFLPTVGLGFFSYRRQHHLLRRVVMNNGGECKDWGSVWLTGGTQPRKAVLSQCVPCIC